MAGVLAKTPPDVTLQLACWGGPDDDPAGLPGTHAFGDSSSAESRRRLIAIVRDFPKPIAAFSCSIGHAVDLHDAGLELGLSIPGELAIVTWTHHPAQSELTDISLSSLSIDYDRQAYEAAAVLDRMMQGETSRPINVIARECGYSSRLILSRTLKRDAGMTPRAYRQKHQGG